MAIDEHGGAKQLLRFRLRPHVNASTLGLIALCVGASWINPAFGLIAGLTAVWTYRNIGAAIQHGRRAIRDRQGTTGAS